MDRYQRPLGHGRLTGAWSRCEAISATRGHRKRRGVTGTRLLGFCALLGLLVALLGALGVW